MAKFTFADGSVFEGTAAELAEYARLAGGVEAEQPAEIEGPVRVGDTIEITEARRGLSHYTEGKRYKVVETSGGRPEVIDDDGDKTAVLLAKYRIVARKEETPQPAKPSVKVGDYVAVDSDNPYLAEETYKVIGIDGDGGPLIEDDDGDEIGLDAHEYRIITDARELAFAKAGRKLDEFKAGDIVRVTENTNGSRNKIGDIGIVGKPTPSGRAREVIVPARVKEYSGTYTLFGEMELIAPAKARVDGE